MWEKSMTNKEILQIAMEQSAIDLNCNAEDFLSKDNVIVVSAQDSRARKYLELPFDLNLVSYGNNIVASTDMRLIDTVKSYIDSFPTEHCFETPNMHVLSDALQSFGLRICFMAEYFLPDVSCLKAIACDYEMKLLKPEDLSDLYTLQWQNALCKKRKHLDVLGVGAYDGDRLVGLAGCSADCDSMWQIGIDVLPQYRRCNIAAALTSMLSSEALKRGKVPFYCAAWSNIPSVRNAIKSGFRPAWIEMTAKPASFVDSMNSGQST